MYGVLILIGCLIASVCSMQEVFAAEDENKLGYVVEPLQPSTQIDPETSYFYIKTTPGETQTLKVRVTSTIKEKVQLRIYGVDASTKEGVIEYTEDEKNKDDTLKEPLSSLLKVGTPEITVGNFEEKTVDIQVTAPKEHYDGVKMGAIVIEKVPDKKKKQGMATKYNYTIGLITSENGDEFTNGKTLKLNEAKATISHGKKMVVAQLQNPEPKMIDKLNIVATMINKETGKVAKEKTVQNYRIAPNSHFDFELDWGVNDLAAGKYTLKLEAKNNNEEWHLSKDFEITSDEAKEINETSVFKIQTPTWLKVTSVLLGIISLVLMGSLFYRRKKWEKAWKRLRIAKKKKKKKKGRSKNKK